MTTEKLRGQPDPRDESQAQRDDRNLAELLQELRISGLGVQVLFGFLLSLPFTVRFTKLSHGQRELYLASLVLSAVATALLLGPVAYHRLVFRQRQKEPLVRAASVMATLGLAAVGLAISAAVLLASSSVTTGLPAALITLFVLVLFAGLWLPSHTPAVTASENRGRAGNQDETMPAHGRENLAMSENRRAAQGSGRAGKTGRGDGHRKAREVEQTHQANVNQMRDEPIPASEDDDPRQEAKRAQGADKKDADGG